MEVPRPQCDDYACKWSTRAVPLSRISAVAGNALTHRFKVQQLNSSELHDGGASVCTSQQAGQA
jgi:hypothetical protein